MECASAAVVSLGPRSLAAEVDDSIGFGLPVLDRRNLEPKAAFIAPLGAN